MNVSESGLAELYRNLGVHQVPHTGVNDGMHFVVEGLKNQAVKPVISRPIPFEGSVVATLILYGHCPSKKNMWERRQAGRMVLPKEVKEQIAAITTQAMFQWKYPGPVEHPEIAMTFFVSAKRQDQDGMYTTILDCLQSAGVLVNDNIAHNNGRKVLEPCEIVGVNDERVVISIRRSR